MLKLNIELLVQRRIPFYLPHNVPFIKNKILFSTEVQINVINLVYHFYKYVKSLIMDSKEKQIIELLNEGCSYNEIQIRLGVSPSRIALVKKEYASQLQNSSSSSSSDNSTTISQKSAKNNPEIDDLSSFNSLLQNSSSDPETLLRLKELELEQQRILKQMEYDEKERERDYERERHEHELEKIRLRNEEKQETQNLKAQLQSIKEELLELQRQQVEEENIDDDEEEFDTSVFFDPFKVFMEMLIERNEEKWDEEDISDSLETIENMKTSYKEICEFDGTNAEEFEEWEILIKAETDLNDLKKEIEDSVFYSRARLSISDEWIDKLKDNISLIN